ncbi:MAG: FAD-binding oxidoreductase [Patescibacteria group bacterium]
MIKTEITKTYVVIEKIVESANVSTLKLRLSDGSVPTYHAGQFINVYFPELSVPEGKAYSMSSAPHEKVLVITVKAVGEFSRRLCALQTGDTVTASLPYGYFYSELEDTSLVFIAADIGVTPFRSIILDSLSRNPSRKLILFYTSRTHGGLTFREEFENLRKKHSNFDVFYFVTREKSPDPAIVQTRVTIGNIVGSGPQKNIAGREFMLCGSISFVGDIWKGLRAAGVPEEAIYTEAFFSH